MRILEELGRRNAGNHEPFLIDPRGTLDFPAIAEAAADPGPDLASIPRGTVVALIGDFDGPTIATMLALLDRGVIVMPLTDFTRADHGYFFESGRAEWVVSTGGPDSCRTALARHGARASAGPGTS